MVGGSVRWGRWWGDRSPSPERRRRRGRPPLAGSCSQLLVETGRSYSEPDLLGDAAELEPRTDPAGGDGTRPRTRTYSLTRLHYSVYLDPSLEAAAAEAGAAGAATLPRARPPITIIGEETRVVDDELVDDQKQKRKKKPLRKFLSVENLRKSVRKSKERMQGIDESLRRQARKTLRRMRTERKDESQHDAASPPPSRSLSPSPAATELVESEAELPPPPPSPPRGATENNHRSRREPTPRSDTSFAEDSLTTSEEPRATPVPPELSIQHELAMAEWANDRADASAAQRPAGEPAAPGSGGGGGGVVGGISERYQTEVDGIMDSTSSEEPARVPSVPSMPSEPSPERAAAAANGTPGTPPPPPARAPGSGSRAAPDPEPRPVNDEDARVEKAEQVIEEQERARHRRLTDVGDNEVGNKYEHLYKILIIGELGTGKTSIIKRYVHQFFSAHYRATIGVDFALKVLHWDPNTIVRLQLWDIAGQERFGSMTRVYYKEAVAAFIVFDVTRAVTFDAVMKWKNDLDQKVQLPNGDCVPCVLLANKGDLPKEGLVSTPEKLTDWAEQHGFLGWFETSAKENTGIEEAANFLVTKILTNEKSGLMASEEDDPDTLAVGDGQPDSKGCSC